MNLNWKKINDWPEIPTEVYGGRLGRDAGYLYLEFSGEYTPERHAKRDWLGHIWKTERATDAARFHERVLLDFSKVKFEKESEYTDFPDLVYNRLSGETQEIHIVRAGMGPSDHVQMLFPADCKLGQDHPNATTDFNEALQRVFARTSLNWEQKGALKGFRKRIQLERQPIELQISPIQFESYSTPTEGEHLFALAIFRGEYRYGAGGRPDSILMLQRIEELCEWTQAEYCIVDLRELCYEWGDDLDIRPDSLPPGAIQCVITEDQTAIRDWLHPSYCSSSVEGAAEAIVRRSRSA